MAADKASAPENEAGCIFKIYAYSIMQAEKAAYIERMVIYE